MSIQKTLSGNSNQDAPDCSVGVKQVRKQPVIAAMIVVA